MRDEVDASTVVIGSGGRFEVSLSAIEDSELGVARGAWKGNHVADIRHPGDVDHGPLEAEAETRMRHGAISAQVAVPVVLFLREPDLIEPCVEHVEPLLAL